MAGEHFQDKMWESAVKKYDEQHRPQRHLRHWYTEKHKKTNGKTKQKYTRDNKISAEAKKTMHKVQKPMQKLKHK